VAAPGRLADELRRIGRQAGLDAVGICDARPFLDAREAIEKRAAAGWSAGMQFTYRNPRRSTDPGATVPGARSLFVGVRHYARRERCAAERPAGRVARYSWIDHYGPLREALGSVATRLIDEGWKARVVADDNALVDRAAAVRAGIGWYGKNTNVLIEDTGSWFVIGSVITDAPIASAIDPQPVPDGCGRCTRCMADCPTGAIVAPGQLDARRCLAWLLQAPGVFPREHREALGDRIYGCDDCQATCPINRRAERRNPWPEAEPGAQESISILDMLSWGDTELLEAVGRWYIPGREPRYIRRNALIVLGNTADGEDPNVAAALQRALSDPDSIVRAHAVWAATHLGRMDLLDIVSNDDDPTVVGELEHAGASISPRGDRA
jgi:epoxyqueuosine reductase